MSWTVSNRAHRRAVEDWKPRSGFFVNGIGISPILLLGQGVPDGTKRMWYHIPRIEGIDTHEHSEGEQEVWQVQNVATCHGLIPFRFSFPFYS